MKANKAYIKIACCKKYCAFVSVKVSCHPLSFGYPWSES